MHWLQSLDIALFHFINGTLSNPFFDWLMPVLSGRGVPWLIAVVIAAPAVFVFGSLRLRLCALLTILVVALGDPLIIGTVRNAVARPRPCLALDNVNALLGCTTSGSMPSAHAANNFAVAMLLFLFYRRSGWFMFPFAASVAFSRVYCGVHYPSDVLAGAILGAGYAIVLVISAQSMWNFIGNKFFPVWHQQLPNLLNPQPSTFNLQSSTIDSHWLKLGYAVIFAALIGRWIYLRSGIIGLSEDEAYQWLWSKHLALSYYSKPPGIALIQWAGTSLFGDTELGVRFFSPLFAAILSLIVLRFLARETGGRTAFWMLMATFATPLLVAGSILMTIDPPLVLCWMWAVIAGWRAPQPGGKTRDWFIVGLAMGLGFLCKYTAMLQIICWIIFFALQPSARIHLKKIGPWLALGVFALCTLPVVIWNWQHGWITVAHVAGDAGLHGQWKPTLNYFWEFTGSEAGLLNPIFFIGMIWAAVAFWKRREEKPLWLFLFCMGAPVFLGHWLYSFHSRAYPNWIAAAVPPLFCLMALFWHERLRTMKPLLCLALVLGIFASVFMYDSDLIGRLAGNRLPGEKDPTHRIRGWRETAALVESEREKLGANSFIIADHYGTTGLYTFYSPAARAAAESQKPLVYCVDSDTPANQFYFWDEYDYRAHRHGENALFVIRLDPSPLEHGWFWKWLKHEPIKYGDIPPPQPAPERIAAEFETVTNLGIREITLRDGRVFQRVQIFGCYNLK